MMLIMDEIFRAYAEEVGRLVASPTTTEGSYYPAIKALLARMLAQEGAPLRSQSRDE